LEFNFWEITETSRGEKSLIGRSRRGKKAENKG